MSWTPELPYYPTPPDDFFNCSAQGPNPNLYPWTTKGNVWCAVDVLKTESKLSDQKIRDNCIQHLKIATNNSTLEDNKRPFFVGCGFHKPHAPYIAPKEFFDNLPPLNDIPGPLDPFAPIGMPAVAWHPPADIHGLDETPAFNGTVNNTRSRVYRRAYYAATSYQDYNIGQVLDALEDLNVVESTVVILFADHGYQLGEHDTWAKMTNFELAVHIPMIIRVPWMKHSIGKSTQVLAEMIDMYPTLAQLAGLPDPYLLNGSEGINGTSLYSVFEDPTNTSVKTTAFSQFAKKNTTDVHPEFFRNGTNIMGYSVRVKDWRYTCWFKFNNETIVPELDYILGTELYDHRNDSGLYLDDPGETVNLVNVSAYAPIVQSLHSLVLDYIRLWPVY
eukprot:m.332939 g.332939  ORF g.332939 m.332939 type:complete len:389 (-) comp17032_c0_seq1:1642-2808(-)